MKLLFAFILLASVTSNAANEAKIELRLDRNNRVHRQTHKFTLTKVRNKIVCEVKGTPSRDIASKGVSLEAPFKNQKIAKSCKNTIQWNKAKSCYRKFDNPSVDHIIRLCSVL